MSVDSDQRRLPIWPSQFSLFTSAKYSRRKIVDKDRVVGSAKQVKGEVKQVIGKAVGDAKLESEGKADKIEGKVQNAIGGIKDTVKDALKGK
jgi:uncharacterized protein YjbJ (UPF0337 family)